MLALGPRRGLRHTGLGRGTEGHRSTTFEKLLTNRSLGEENLVDPRICQNHVCVCGNLFVRMLGGDVSESKESLFWRTSKDTTESLLLFYDIEAEDKDLYHNLFLSI